MPREQLASGVQGLDEVLRGGLPRGALYAVSGAPGTGKTVLAHQIASERLRNQGSVLYLTALVESHETLLTQARSFTFFDPSWAGGPLYYASLLPVLQKHGIEGLRTAVGTMLQERQPDVVVLDGVAGLKSMVTDPGPYHMFLSFLQAHAATSGRIILLLGNDTDPDAADPMFTTADGIFLLRTDERGRRRARSIEVRKLRGRSCLLGSHLLQISDDGVRIYPRLEARLSAGIEPIEMPSGEWIRFGIDGLDKLLHGGLGYASATLVAGTAGAGKTSMALSFMTAGMEAGERSIMLAFHESPDRLLFKADSLGLPLRAALERGTAEIRWHPSADLLVDAVAEDLLITVDRSRVDRVAIDGLGDLARGLLDEHRVVPFLNAFTDLLRAKGVSVLLTHELSHVFTLDFVLPFGEVSAAVDNIILLRYVEDRSRVRRLISALKVRDHEYDPSVREFHFTGRGLEVGDIFRAGVRLATASEDDEHGGSH